MYLAVDIGGTKTLLAWFTPEGEVVKTYKFATPTDYPTFIAMLGSELKTFLPEAPSATAVAIPGRLDRASGVAIAFGNRPWENVPLKADIAAFLDCPITIENDSKTAGLSEARLLMGQYRKSLYVTISTGISSALVVDGHLDPETRDSEVGQMLLEYEGKLQDWEDFGSGRAFAAKFGKRVSDIAPDSHEAWYYIARNIAIGLINLVAAYTPEVIILGGGVGAHLDKFKDRLDEQLKIYESPLFTTPPIVKAQRPEEAVIYGCYELLKEPHENTPR